MREWQKRFKDGYYDSKNLIAQLDAGWYDWFCGDASLAGRLKKIAPVVMGVTSPFILDNYYVWFKNNSMMCGQLYDDVRFEPLSGERDGKYFLVALDSPAARAKWSLITERFSFETAEFECGNVREMARYLNTLGGQLEKGIEPPFLAEKAAAVDYIMKRPDFRHSRNLRREGEHGYSVFLPDVKRRVTVHVAQSLEGSPPGFQAEKAAPVNGLFVSCPEDGGEPVPPAPKRKPKKEVTR